MLRVNMFVSVTLLLAIAFGSTAQEQTQIEIPTLVKYESSPDLPNGIAFYSTLGRLERIHNESGGVESAALVARKLELSIVESHNLVSEALTTLYLMKTEDETQLRSHSCLFAGTEVSKADKYAALQQTYVITNAVYDHYYDQFKATLSSDTGERLQLWMNERKLSISHYESDFEEADKLTGLDSTQTLSMLCGTAQ